MRRHALVLSIFAGLLLAAFAVGASAQQFSSLQERMSSEQFKAAGLDKLSPQELASLNAFVRGEMDKRVAAARGKQDPARAGFHESGEYREPIVSHIPGTFRGWDGGTTFHLANGQVWRQIQSDSRLQGIRMQDPEVTIKPGLLGSWELSVKGYSAVTKVERVQ
jgi:hypothetical protein